MGAADSWARHFVGAPYELGASGPRAYDCWSLVRAVYQQQLGVILPDAGPVALDYARAVALLASGKGDAAAVREARDAKDAAIARGWAAESWRAVLPKDARTFDVLGMRDARGGRCVAHVGVMLDDRRVLHIENGTGAVIERINHPLVAFRVAGVRRHISQC